MSTCFPIPKPFSSSSFCCCYAWDSPFSLLNIKKFSVIMLFVDFASIAGRIWLFDTFFCLAFVIVLEAKDGTISVASAFPGHQEGMIISVSSSIPNQPNFFPKHYFLLLYQLYRIETTSFWQKQLKKLIRGLNVVMEVHLEQLLFEMMK